MAANTMVWVNIHYLPLAMRPAWRLSVTLTLQSL